ncbi:MAG: phosphatase PAP2 family protein [Mycobacteriales bacterium]
MRVPMVFASGDTGDFRFVNDFARHTSWLHGPMVAYANDGVLLFGLLLVTGYLLARRAGSLLGVARALLVGAGVLLAVAVNQPIVHAVNEPRPYTRLPHALLLVHRSLDASFPSDHATMAGAAAAGLLWAHRRLGWAAVAAAALMAFSRVYVGAHYPIDVLAGLAVGAAVAALTQQLAGPLSALLYRLLSTKLQLLLTARQADAPQPARSSPSG